jgi:hypothetical protein
MKHTKGAGHSVGSNHSVNHKPKTKPAKAPAARAKLTGGRGGKKGSPTS